MTLSVLIPARDAQYYLPEALASIPRRTCFPVEIIVVDDNSSDNTWRTLETLAATDERIHAVRNLGHGKVAALNTAFQNSTGDLVTTLDSDDVLLPAYFEYLDIMPDHADASVRDYTVTDSALRPIAAYRMSDELLENTFTAAAAALVSLPRATWTIRRPIAERVFPIPLDLPFEDVWFSLMIRKYATEIHHPNRSMYLYRQHTGQTYGGVLDHSPPKVRFRANRLHTYARLLPTHALRFGGPSSIPDMSQRTTYYELLKRRTLTVTAILRSPIGPQSKLRVFVSRKLWFFVGPMKRLQWAIARIRAAASR